MKIMFAIPKPMALFFGGMEMQVLETKKTLEENSVNVEFISYSDRDAFHGVDLVHFFHVHYSFSDLAKILREKRIPYVVSTVFYRNDGWIRTWLRNRVSRVSFTRAYLERDLLDNASALITASKAEARKVDAFFSIDNRNIHVIPLGIDDSFTGNGQRFFDKYLHGFLSCDQPFILHVARTEPIKNTLELIQASIKMDLPLVIIGPENTAFPSYLQAVKDLINEHPHKVLHLPFFEPKSQDLADSYAAARVHALPSKWETTGLASLEAGLNGANLVVGRCAPVEEIFGGLAEFCDPDDTADIAKALRIAVSLPRNALDQAEAIKQKYSWNTVVNKLMNVYQQVLS